jgi:hypothetical protein
MAIDGYSISGYWWLLMVIYWWLLYYKLLLIILQFIMIIGDYSIISYCWIF